MLKQILVALVGLLTITSAFKTTFENNIFNFNERNNIAYQLFQTRGGIIAHDILEARTYQEFYSLINLQDNNVSVILSDIVDACTNTSKIPNFDRLSYHAATSSLVYYCGNNNSLLIIDQSSYTVELTIPTNIDANFDDVKLVSQGYSIAILGMTGILTHTPKASQLIIIDLQSHTVANHVVFNHDFKDDETVVGYAASSKNELYILTSTLTKSDLFSNVTLYSMFLIGNSYTISNLTDFINIYYAQKYTIPEVYSVGTLLVVSYGEDLAVVSSQGHVLGTVKDLAVKSPTDLNDLQYVALAVQYGSSDFYALLANQTLLKYSVQGSGYKVDAFASNIIDLQYASSNLSSGSLLFTTDANNLFNIIDLKTSQSIYSTLAGATNFMVTDTTYAVDFQLSLSELSIVYIFSRETNLLIYQSPPCNFYYDIKSQLISYMDYTNNSQVQCHMVQLDIQTTKRSIPFILDTIYGTDCLNYNFLDVNNDQATPQFILDNSNNLLIYSETFGLANYGTYTSWFTYDTFFADYDTLTVSIASELTDMESQVSIAVYAYNQNTQTFDLQKTLESDLDAMGSFNGIGQLFVMSGSEFEFMNMTTFQQTKHSYSLDALPDVSFFQDKTNAVYTVFGYLQHSIIYYDSQFTPLTGATDSTITASSAGQCRYSVANRVKSQYSDTIVASFYNVCSESYLAEDILA